MQYSDHRLWRLYENVTAVAGWGILASLAWIMGDIIIPESMPEWPLVGEVSYWLIGCVSWIFKADIVKYRITRDSRDHPLRKWGTFRNVKRHKFIMLRKGTDPSSGEQLVTTVCPACDALHGFEHMDKTPRTCNFDGCQEVIYASHR